MCLSVVLHVFLHVFVFFSYPGFLMLFLGKNPPIMDKKTLIRLAQPAATALLAISVMTLPITVKAYGDSMEVSGSITVYCEMGSCQN